MLLFNSFFHIVILKSSVEAHHRQRDEEMAISAGKPPNVLGNKMVC